MSTFVKKSKIRFGHCDSAGIVFYPRYFEMLNDLVEDWFTDELNYPFDKMHLNNGVPTVDLKVNFNLPGKLGEDIIKILWVNKIGNSSLNYGFKFVKNDTVLIEGTATLVHVIINKNEGIKSEKWPAEIAKNIRRFLAD